MMTTSMVLALTGCGLFDKIKETTETLEGLTNPLVAQGLILGVEEPESEDISLEDAGYAPGTTVTVFLADATDAADMENAPIEGATVKVSGGSANATASEEQPGAYLIDPTEGLAYAASSLWTLSATIDGRDEASTATISLPAAAAVTVPETQDETGQPLSLDLTGQGFASALVVVFNAECGEFTYSNEPNSVTEIYNFGHGDGEATEVEIPGSAFPEEGVYAVGIAGMVHTTADDLNNFNTALSTFMAGKMVIYPSVVGIPDIPDTFNMPE